MRAASADGLPVAADQFGVSQPHLHSSNHEFTVSFAQALQRGLVAFDDFGAHRGFERRQPRVREALVELDARRMPAGMPEFASNPVHDALPEVGAQRAFAAVLEALDPLKRLEQHLLNNVGRVCQVAGPPGEPAAGPFPQARQVAGKQVVERLGIAGPGAGEERQRRVPGRVGVGHGTDGNDSRLRIRCQPPSQYDRRGRGRVPEHDCAPRCPPHLLAARSFHRVADPELHFRGRDPRRHLSLAARRGFTFVIAPARMSVRSPRPLSYGRARLRCLPPATSRGLPWARAGWQPYSRGTARRRTRCDCRSGTLLRVAFLYPLSRRESL